MRKKKDKVDIDRELAKIDDAVFRSIVDRHLCDHDAVKRELIEYYPVLADESVMKVYYDRQRKKVDRSVLKHAPISLRDSGWQVHMFRSRFILAEVLARLDDLLDNAAMVSFIQGNVEVRKMYLDLIDMLELDYTEFGHAFQKWYVIESSIIDGGGYDGFEGKDEIAGNVEKCYEHFVRGVVPAITILKKMHDKIMIKGENK